ncbi:VanZ family protein [Salibacterium sp. K-3]
MKHLHIHQFIYGIRTLVKEKPIIMILLLLYLSVLFYVTLLAWDHGSSYGPTGPGGRNYNLDLFESIYRIAVYSTDFIDPIVILGGNIIMFFPFGLLAALLMNHRKKAWWLVLVFSVILSVFIEINQFIFTHRVANVDDVLLNTVGGMLGVQFVMIVRRWHPKFYVAEQEKDNV